ncbi:TolC family protein [Leeuwenhoekiella sp. A2]|uniref:TolC family protein n=2 Tax=unclassified Leeuwenhoekiella TaxID=2615029 RepID=UPI003A80FDB0
MKYGMLIMGCFVLSYSVTCAQTSENIPLSQLYQEAAAYPGLQAEASSIKSADYDYRLAKQKILPDLNLQAQNTFGTFEGAAGAFIPLPGFFNVSGTGINGNTAVNSMASATIKWDFLRFGKYRDQVQLAQVNQQQARTSFDIEALKLKHEVTQVYLGWMYSNAMHGWANREAERNKNLLQLSSSLVRSGLASAADSLIASTSLQQARGQIKKWEAQTNRFKNQLFEYTGTELINENVPKPFFLITQAEVHNSIPLHPLLTEKEHQQERLEVREEIINHQVFPDISLLAGGLVRGVGFGDDSQAFQDSYQLPINNYLMGVGLTWDLSQWYSKGLKTQQVQEEQQRVAQEMEVVKRSLNEQQNSLQFHIQKSKEEIIEAEAAYQSAAESYRLFKVRYESGLIDLTTLLQIQQSLQFTEKSRIEAYYDYWQYWNNYAYTQADFSVLTTVFN